MGWRFFEMGLNSGGDGRRGWSAVERHTRIQDYAETGMRCQDVELFVKALYMRQIGRITAPSFHKGIDLVMAWVNRAYGHLRMGKRLLVSNCDWMALPSEMPEYWRRAFDSMGALRGLVPFDGEKDGQRGRTPEVTYRQARKGVERTVRVGGAWSLGRLLMEPLFYNPLLAGWWGAAALEEASVDLSHRLAKEEVQTVATVHTATQAGLRGSLRSRQAMGSVWRHPRLPSCELRRPAAVVG